MNRRDLLKMIAAATGTAVVGSNALLAGCSRAVTVKDFDFDPGEVALLDEVAETIIPRTDTPGAKDAKVGQLMVVMVNDCYSPEDREIFHRGMLELEDASQDEFGASFMQLSAEQRKQLLSDLDGKARLHNAVHSDPHYFTLMKQLTLFGFFTSEVGATKVLRYEAIPGRYDGCIPYKKGDRAWAT